MIKIIIFLSLLSQILFSKTLYIALASNMYPAFKQLQAEFSKTNKIILHPIISSSGKLAFQILNGAKFDIFISADTFYTNKIYTTKDNLTKPYIYAKGELILYTNRGIDLKSGINILSSKSIRSIAIANPKIAPYGKAAMDILKNSKLLSTVKHKLIFAQSAIGAYMYANENTDIAIISKSLIHHIKKIKSKQIKNINRIFYTPISQSMILLNNNKSSKLFYDFLKSKKAKSILKTFGYIVE
jgi:molybdate transport system substrate-binding protein